MGQFSLIHLEGDRLDEALPIVRMTAPMVTSARWRRYARYLAENDGGILAAFAGDGNPHGIAGYCVQKSLTEGRTLHVEPMVTCEISQSAPVRAALCEALETIASTKGCESLRIVAGSRGFVDAWSIKADNWASLDMELMSVALVKCIEPRLRPKRSSKALDQRL